MIPAVPRILLFWGIDVITDPQKKEKGFGFLAGTCLLLVAAGFWMAYDSREPQIGHLFSAVAYGAYVVIGGIRELLHFLGPRIVPKIDNGPYKNRLADLLGVPKR